MKIYKSENGLAISVTLDNGRNRYLSFNPVSDGSAYLRVKDKKVMKAVERHRYFNKLFKIYYDDEPKTEKIVKAAPAVTSMKPAAVKKTEPVPNPIEAEDGSGYPEEGQNPSEVVMSPANDIDDAVNTVMRFDCFDDARDFLNETYGIPKKRLMSKAMVITEGESVGLNVEFNN